MSMVSGSASKPQHVYTVRFAARELWGDAASLAIPCMWTCGRITWSAPDTSAARTHAERLAALPGLPRDEGEPVFAEPWQAQAFALAVKLSEQGHFTWVEWAAALADELSSAAGTG